MFCLKNKLKKTNKKLNGFKNHSKFLKFLQLLMQIFVILKNIHQNQCYVIPFY